MPVAEDVFAVLRQWDRPRFLALLFAPDERRYDLMALHAFNAEIDRIPLVVSEPQIGEIRLQWWRDTLASIAERKPQDHPVAEALAGAVARHQLPIKPLLDLVEAHSHDLYADRFADRHALEEYLGKTHSALIQLSAIILDREAAPGAAVAAGLAGVAYGLGQILSDPKRHANLLPLDETLGSLAELARRRLQGARTLHIPTSLRPAFHHVSLTELFLKHPGHPPSSVRQQWALWRMARTNSF